MRNPRHYPENPDPYCGPKAATADAADLTLYQAHLGGKLPGKFKPKNDGSLLALTAHSEITLARAAAQIIGRRDKKKNLNLITGSQAGIRDQALRAEDEPVVGLHLRSSARPIPQLLILTLRLCWQPANPGALLEFLTHPASLMVKLLRQRLSDALAGSPGIPVLVEVFPGAAFIGASGSRKRVLETIGIMSHHIGASHQLPQSSPRSY